MPYQFPEIIKDGENKKLNLKAEGTVDWDHQKCNAKEIYNPSRETKSKNSKQSPININTEAVQECHLLCKLDINYKPSKCHIERTEQGIIKLNWDPGSFIKYNNTNYELKHIQFHTPSLHHVDGNSSEMEINLYHYNHQSMDELHNEESEHQGKKKHSKNIDKIKNKKKPKILKDDHPHTDNYEEYNQKGHKAVILSILVNHTKITSQDGETQATRPNMFISQFIHNRKFLDLKKKEKQNREHETYDISVHKDWNVSDLLPKSKAYFTYDGSIPNPPCVEDIKWIIMEQHIEVIEEFINIIREQGNIKGNRDIHPLNNRLVFYNNNIEVNNEEVEGEIIDKHKEVKKILSPIRIRVDDRTGYDYRKKAQKIIASYRGGIRSNYMTDQRLLDQLNQEFDKIGKIGYEERFAKDIVDDNMADGELNDDGLYFIKHLVFDQTSYDGNYFRLSLPIFDLNIDSKNDILDNKDNIIAPIDKLITDMNEIYTNFTDIDFKKDTDTGKKFDYEQFKLNLLEKINNIANSDNNLKKIKEHINDDKKLIVFYLLLDWDMDITGNAPRLIYKLDSNINIKELHISFWKDYFSLLNGYIGDDKIQEENKKEVYEIIFKSQSDDLRTTINNHSCQTWGSNQVHHEHSFWNALSKTTRFNPRGYTYEEIEEMPFSEKRELKKAIRDGLLDKVGDRYIPNNKCRNPNGSATAAWCYTTNPKVRWDYCMKPDISFKSRRLLLFFIFIFIIYLSYFTVKTIFKYNMFNKFIAMLTGAQMPKDLAFKAGQVANTIKNNLKG